MSKFACGRRSCRSRWAEPRPIPISRRSSETLRARARSGRRSEKTPCRSWFPATASSARAESSPAIIGGLRASARCSAGKRRRSPEAFLERDLFRRPVPTPDQVRGRLFRDHALALRRRRKSVRNVDIGRRPVLEVALAKGFERDGIEFIYKVGEPGIGGAAHFRQTADGACKGFQRLVIGTAVIIEKM